ncbi:MAG: PAS domain S-box protein [Nitrospirae bacterium]|nr:PAS domain S-box protein [Nitrospirota bacterium]
MSSEDSTFHIPHSALKKPLRLLIVEDSEDDALLLLRELKKGGYMPVSERIETSEAMKTSLEKNRWDIIISDYVLPRFSGLAALNILKESGQDIPFIIVSGNIGEDIAVEAMKAGAHDYIIKGNLKRLIPAVERELREAGVRGERKIIEEDRIRLMAAVESAPDAIMITDASGMVQYMNPSFERITGYSREEAIGHHLHMLDRGSNDEAVYQAIREAMKQGRPWNGLIISKKKDGTLYHEDCTISSIKDVTGKMTNYVSVRRDVTDKLRFESIAEAVNTMNSIGYVFSGIRHEIGNPVNSIKMTLNVLKKNLDKYGKENILEYIDRALSESSRIEYLLKSFKNFNMFEKPEMQDVEIGPFMYNFHALVLGDSMSKGITITRAVSEDAKFFYVDPRALQQVLLNLFTNAVDACEGRKEPVIDISVSKIPGMIFMLITDNGRGMTEEQQKDLFKPFHTSKSHGTGLGLVICKKMLSRMNCFIEVKSIKDKGTTVDILIPDKKS